MHRGRLAFVGFLLAVALVQTSVAQTPEPIVRVVPPDTLLLLDDNLSPPRWVPLDAKSVDLPALLKPAGEYSFGKHHVRLTSKNQVEVRKGNDAWKATSLRPPPAGISYESVLVNHDGAVIVALGGTSAGSFNYIEPRGKVVIGGSMEWVRPPPKFRSFAPGISGRSFLAAADDGSVWHVQPPGKNTHKFSPKQVLPAGSAQSLYARDEDSAWLETPTGEMLLLTGSASKGYTTTDALGAGQADGANPIVTVESRRGGSSETLKRVLPTLTIRPPPETPAGVSVASSEFARPSTLFADVTAEALLEKLRKDRTRSPEFKLIARLAEKHGLRVFVFGGTAASLAHYNKWDLLFQSGDQRFLPQRMDHDYVNVFRDSQDLDLVISRRDGTPESAEDIRWFQRLIEEHFPYMMGASVGTGKQSRWEVRGLRTANGRKEALYGNKLFRQQNSDSMSTGLIELTEPSPGESIVRDLRDWDSPLPAFLRDVALGRVFFYCFPALHASTPGAQSGENPEIVGAVRYLAKAFQFGLSIDKASLVEVGRIFAKFDPKALTNAYAKKRLISTGRKLFTNAIDLERAWNVLDALGAREKLGYFGSPSDKGSLAWLMNKEPMRVEIDHPRAHRYSGGNWGGRQRRTAGELGITLVTHETQSYGIYEAITRSPKGYPNVFISRSGGNGEAAAQGDGFYTKRGQKGDAPGGGGFNIRFLVDPNAREGIDFVLGTTTGHVVWRNASVLRIVPEEVRMDPQWALEKLLDSRTGGEAALRELLRRRIPRMAMDDAALEKLREYLRPIVATVVKTPGKKSDAFRQFQRWWELGMKGAPASEFLTLDDAIRFRPLFRKLKDLKRWIEEFLPLVNNADDFARLLTLDDKEPSSQKKKLLEGIYLAHRAEYLAFIPTVAQRTKLEKRVLSTKAGAVALTEGRLLETTSKEEYLTVATTLGDAARTESERSAFSAAVLATLDHFQKIGATLPLLQRLAALAVNTGKDRLAFCAAEVKLLSDPVAAFAVFERNHPLLPEADRRALAKMADTWAERLCAAETNAPVKVLSHAAAKLTDDDEQRLKYLRTALERADSDTEVDAIAAASALLRKGALRQALASAFALLEPALLALRPSVTSAKRWETSFFPDQQVPFLRRFIAANKTPLTSAALVALLTPPSGASSATRTEYVTLALELLPTFRKLRPETSWVRTLYENLFANPMEALRLLTQLRPTFVDARALLTEVEHLPAAAGLGEFLAANRPWVTTLPATADEAWILAEHLGSEKHALDYLETVARREPSAAKVLSFLAAGPAKHAAWTSTLQQRLRPQVLSASPTPSEILQFVVRFTPRAEVASWWEAYWPSVATPGTVRDVLVALPQSFRDQPLAFADALANFLATRWPDVERAGVAVADLPAIFSVIPLGSSLAKGLVEIALRSSNRPGDVAAVLAIARSAPRGSPLTLELPVIARNQVDNFFAAEPPSFQDIQAFLGEVRADAGAYDRALTRALPYVKTEADFRTLKFPWYWHRSRELQTALVRFRRNYPWAGGGLLHALGKGCGWVMRSVGLGGRRPDDAP